MTAIGWVSPYALMASASDWQSARKQVALWSWRFLNKAAAIFFFHAALESAQASRDPWGAAIIGLPVPSAH
jgi:hypothetical protein